MAIPNYDRGVALNMTVLMRSEPAAFDREQLPEWVWMSNLFGRATHNLVLAEELKRAYDLVDRELKVVADIQRSLLPKVLPAIPTLDLAAHYQTSQWAGGDYYDFFPLADGQWGILIADVSGHGTPAAVMMAITHSIAHALPRPPGPPGDDARPRQPPPRRPLHRRQRGVRHRVLRHLRPGAARADLRQRRAQPAPAEAAARTGASPRSTPSAGSRSACSPTRPTGQATHLLVPGDQIVFYTDGITEATNPAGEMFGLDRLDEALENCHLVAVRPDASRARRLGRLHRRPARRRRPDPGGRQGLVSGEWGVGRGAGSEDGRAEPDRIGSPSSIPLPSIPLPLRHPSGLTPHPSPLTPHSEIPSMRIGVTGATGFLGRYIVAHLVGQGHHCRCWYRPSSDLGGLKAPEGAITWVEGSLGDAEVGPGTGRGV